MTGIDIATNRKRRASSTLRKRLWIRLRTRLVGSDRAMSVLAGVIVGYFRFVFRTNRLVEFDVQQADRMLAENAPIITTCWHGQHFMAPMFTRNGEPSVAMVSRSKDAELNARVVERLGFRTVRASGGRNANQSIEKGAIRGIMALRNELRAGHSVFMMADIPHGTPRKAGMGIISVARFSGAPIVPVAYASSRRYVFRSAWDKAVLNLPFGRAAFYFGDPIRVPADADDEMMEQLRLELQDTLDGLLDKAYSTVDVSA
jgi:lysophospholipid acyltransferase (LPLAT)-like uncharacterized protein